MITAMSLPKTPATPMVKSLAKRFPVLSNGSGKIIL